MADRRPTDPTASQPIVVEKRPPLQVVRVPIGPQTGQRDAWIANALNEFGQRLNEMDGDLTDTKVNTFVALNRLDKVLAQLSPGSEFENRVTARARQESHNDIEELTEKVEEFERGNTNPGIGHFATQQDLEMQTMRRELESWRARGAATDRRVDRGVIVWAAILGSVAMGVVGTVLRIIEAAFRGHW